jgi:two-component system, chemotaxis family, chemotaxis protein CheY
MVLQVPKKRVVLVDDDDQLRLVMKTAINSMNCEVVGEGVDGDAAVSLYRQHRPDLLLLDVNMAGKNGPQALREIRQEFPSAFVIMLTASGDLDTVKECIINGAARYILKDASVARIRVMVGEALGMGVGTPRGGRHEN